ncbi:hypothetical protein [Methylobacterium radiodurans]|uniref:Uncharacterized protein n=1 Tax=Methylobacterium radiodurans TaxID=2202828 RepID=A0A2U8VM60_9HYPH|nr:hypothetical protein [Methylobacterium radiodurans]AWN34657.1 hypothetical protein DK427_01985 [Methylobacterium radiodurans]
MSAHVTRAALAALALAVGIGGAGAVEPYRYGHGAGYGTAYAPAYGYGAPRYGFADEAVRGAYIGAPLTRFPRPSEIVPPAWSYGTYGVPTVSGIPPAPVGEPTLTVINAREPARRPAPGPRILARDAGGGWSSAEAGGYRPAGVRVIEVQVPRR